MSELEVTGLEAEIAEARREIASDSYPVGISERTNQYREGELIINPAFQRFFRWDEHQKARLVESVLLGIPLPSIFVSQREDGRWELVDGLQRVATLLELQGVLKDGEGNPLPSLELRGTKYLPALEGKRWPSEDGAESETTLTQAQQLDIKRSKIDVKIIKRESSQAAKYDLFQRLNSYGSPLTAQEMRSALLVSVSSEFYDWIEELSEFEPFVDCVALSDRLVSEKYDVELALRFMILHNRPEQMLVANVLRDFAQVLDDESVSLAENFPQAREQSDATFRQTFTVLAENGGSDAFRKWNEERQTFAGGFLNTAYEVIAMGLGYHVAQGDGYRTDVLAAARELWQRPDMETRFATGVSTETRLSRMIPLGRQVMAAAS
jgi:hypothetical protein